MGRACRLERQQSRGVEVGGWVVVELHLVDVCANNAHAVLEGDDVAVNSDDGLDGLGRVGQPGDDDGGVEGRHVHAVSGHLDELVSPAEVVAVGIVAGQLQLVHASRTELRGCGQGDGHGVAADGRAERVGRASNLRQLGGEALDIVEDDGKAVAAHHAHGDGQVVPALKHLDLVHCVIGLIDFRL